jgi:peroxiredoxin 2/4
MKKTLLCIVGVLFMAYARSQSPTAASQSNTSAEDRNFKIPLIGETAPSFTAESTGGTINFPEDYGRKWKVLFSHPQDFTPVCSTEIVELARLQDEFDKLGIKLVVISVDGLETHMQWKKSLESLKINGMNSVHINFPLVDDDNLVVSKKYGMIHPLSNTSKSVRGVFIIDPGNVIQAEYFYPKNVGRSTDELLRLVTALQATSSGDVLAPVNWKAGGDLLVPVPPKADETGKTILPDGYYSPIWYLTYRKAAK